MENLATGLPVQHVNGKIVPMRYTWPGVYPIYYIAQDYRPICPDCIPRYLGGEDYIIACEVNWEDPDMFCDSCGGRVESAYAEEEDK